MKTILATSFLYALTLSDFHSRGPLKDSHPVIYATSLLYALTLSDFYSRSTWIDQQPYIEKPVLWRSSFCEMIPLDNLSARRSYEEVCLFLSFENPWSHCACSKRLCEYSIAWISRSRWSIYSLEAYCGRGYKKGHRVQKQIRSKLNKISGVTWCAPQTYQW